MMTFEKNIPIIREYSMREIIQSMEVGDSYLFKEKSIRTIASIISKYRNDRKNRKYITRQVEWWVRAWRVE